MSTDTCADEEISMVHGGTMERKINELAIISVAYIYT